ncbi:MAG TPA: malto-oligosyltrehalose trehalohydrolase [Azospirillaceae bacterium]|nr:malto-oligosyltrehalose trehalohydrolase [Azospirillaceae bacterium]
MAAPLTPQSSPSFAASPADAWPQGSGLEALAEMALPGYLLGQRWYGGKDAGTPSAHLLDLLPFEVPEHPAALAVWQVEAGGRAPQRYVVPLALVPASDLPADSPAILAKAHPATGERVLVDAFASDHFVRALVRRILGDERGAVRLRAGRTGAAAFLVPGDDWAIRRGKAEQSNTSIVVGDGAILKIFRRLEEGIHPELEMGRYLTGPAKFEATPRLLGWAELAPPADRGGDPSTLCVLQGFVENRGDGWSFVLEGLGAGEDRLDWLATLGRRTAEMHRALARATDEKDFRPEPVSADDLDGWAEGARAMAQQALDALSWAGPGLTGKARELADRVDARRSELLEKLDRLLPAAADIAKTRHHGDFHLGQVLVTPDGDAVLVDFEGEPLRPLAARRAKHSPLRDVAGMLRSFSYAAAATARAGQGVGRAEEDRLTDWSGRASQAFLSAYLDSATGCPGCAENPRDTVRLVRFFMLEKALYEVLYELTNRPDWADIPLAGVLAILDEEGPVAPAAKLAAVPEPARRAHAMPFGAEVREDGRVRFRLWAPSHEAVRLEIDGEEVELEREEGGWHGLTTDRAKPGSRYRFVLPDGLKVPDPASRHQPEDIHGPSEVIDPRDFSWRDTAWKGRPWEEAVVYEMHVGAFTPEGTFRAAIDRLDHLVQLGVTAIEVMPVADFPGARNWGYDGVLLYAPDASYGRPEDFKAFVDAAHQRGLMVMLDVVYNHYGPEGNYLHAISPAFFTEKHHTPWGAAVNFDDTGSEIVREFVVHNALYWIEEFHLDGLRLDAVHAIMDSGPRHLLEELAERVRASTDRPVHLVLENEENQASRLERDGDNKPRQFSAQWNDDVHHVLHVGVTGESAGYYGDYHGQPEKLARALAEGFAFQGEVMPYRGHERGEPSGRLPPTAFVNFLQNHDQVGNRAFGDRITDTASPDAVRAAAATYLLAPQIPMIFMGEEWASAKPFPFFADFGPELSDAVREGRRKEFARFPEFQDPETRERIPDPTAEGTFLSAKLDWEALSEERHAHWLDWYRRVIEVRKAEIVPHLSQATSGGQWEVIGGRGVLVRWPLGTRTLTLALNLSAEAVEGFPAPSGRVLWTEGEPNLTGRFGPWSMRLTLEEGGGGGGGLEAEESRDPLTRLAEVVGIEASYSNAQGEDVRTPPETQSLLLAAMGIRAETPEQAAEAFAALERREWGRPLSPASVVRVDTPTVLVTLPAETWSVAWRVALEEGGERAGRAAFAELQLKGSREIDGRRLECRVLPLPEGLPWGYHRIEVDGGEGAFGARLIVTPGRCWLPDRLRDGGRLWGLAAQLYTVRSRNDWGIGDFGSLRDLVQMGGRLGAELISLNPLHALFPDNPEHASPYSPASRLLLNPLYIDVTGMPEFAGCPEAQELVSSRDFQRGLTAARAAKLVDYTAVSDLKMQALGALYHACRGSTDPARWQAFEAFRREGGEALERGCLFLALRQHFATQDPAKADWRRWPKPFQDPRSPAVAKFAKENRDRVDFLVWLQWAADDQLGRAAEASREAGMEIGLYRDLAVGADRAGAEVWAEPSAVVSGAQVGAPPDIFNPAGQNWGLPPLHPTALREQGYRSFIELLRANMRHAGALRIDHVMALQHLYWIPEGRPASEGAYVAYPMDDMVGILALESQRQRCLVVGEDLGTVPPGFREKMAEADVLSYRVVFFEQDMSKGDYAAPTDYPALALAMAGTHDLPTLRGWWNGTDIALKDRLGLLPGEGERQKQDRLRARDRVKLIQAMRAEGLLAEGEEKDVGALVRATHAFLARSAAGIALVQLDDVTGEDDPVNLPGTDREHPNWRRKLSRPLEDLARDRRLAELAELFGDERGGAGVVM